MLGYYFRLSLLSIRRTPVLSVLMCLAIAIGIGASMTTITINYLMSADPLPQKSHQIFYVQLDTVGLNASGSEDGLPPDQLTWMDSINLFRDNQAKHQAAMTMSAAVIEMEQKEPYVANIRVTHGDFFPMFNVPFQFGQGWNRQQDLGKQAVIVLNHATNQLLFDGQNSVGQTLRLKDRLFEIIGVLAPWRPSPKFYDVSLDAFGEAEDVYIPFYMKEDMELASYGDRHCWKDPESNDFASELASECTLYQYWVELEDDSARSAYKDYLDHYALEQKKLGRFERPLNNQLTDIMARLTHKEVVSQDNRILMWLSLMFFVVCLLNTVSLMLSKFSHKSHEIALRKALGATSSQLMLQCLTESTVIGLLGGGLGLIFTLVGLIFVEMSYGQIVAELVSLDPMIIASTITLSVFSTIAAAWYPTWKSCHTSPAAQLKV